MKPIFLLVLTISVASGLRAAAPETRSLVLKAVAFQHHFEDFNKSDRELYRVALANPAVRDFIEASSPLYGCPDTANSPQIRPLEIQFPASNFNE